MAEHDERMSDETTGKNDAERDDNLSALAKDVAHPFDQTNGIVDGLEGNADDPDQVDKRMDEGERETPLAAPGGGGANAGDGAGSNTTN